MILYTPLCQEDVFPSTFESTYEYIQVQGKTICVDKQEESYKIVQLLSTNPSDFMDTSFQPGTDIPIS
ncbi:MAG TPA: YlzJ-like family protein [Bacillota bacterium]|nr:YlzJ-like family protein [Bacillota bacterium]